MALERETLLYRGHQIIANKTGAMIYPEKHFIKATEMTESLSFAKEWIDSKYAERRVNRRKEYIGTVDDCVDALRSITLGEHLHKMLVAHKNAELHRLTATQLANAAGWPSYSSANAHYGNLAKQVAEYIGLKIPDFEDAPWTLALADFEKESNEWIMHNEVVEALERLNIT